MKAFKARSRNVDISTNSDFEMIKDVQSQAKMQGEYTLFWYSVMMCYLTKDWYVY